MARGLRLFDDVVQWLKRSSLVAPATDEDRNVRLLYLNTAIFGIPAGGITAFLPVFLARLGASPALLGWHTAAPALLVVFVLIPAAMIAERYADQVRVRVRSAMIYQVFYLVCALVPFVVPAAWLPVLLVILWTLKTVPEAVAIPAWTSVIARAVSPKRRARLNGTRWALLSVMSAASSALFGWMLDRIAFPLNYQLVFFISFGAAWLDPYFFSFIRVPPLSDAIAERSRNILRHLVEYLRPVFSHQPFVGFLGATFLYRIALSMPVPLFTLYWVNQLRAPDTFIGFRGTVGHISLVFGYMVWGRSANRIGHRRVLIICALGLALYPLLTAISPNSWWLFPAAAVWGLTASGVDIGLFDIMLASCPSYRGPLFAAVWSLVANAAMFIGPLLGSALADVSTVAVALAVAGFAQAATTIPLLTLPKDD